MAGNIKVVNVLGSCRGSRPTHQPLMRLNDLDVKFEFLCLHLLGLDVFGLQLQGSVRNDDWPNFNGLRGCTRID